MNDDDDYKPRDDFAKSITACYEAIKERVARGGKPWTPKGSDNDKQQGQGQQLRAINLQTAVPMGNQRKT